MLYKKYFNFYPMQVVLAEDGGDVHFRLITQDFQFVGLKIPFEVLATEAAHELVTLPKGKRFLKCVSFRGGGRRIYFLFQKYDPVAEVYVGDFILTTSWFFPITSFRFDVKEATLLEFVSVLGV